MTEPNLNLDELLGLTSDDEPSPAKDADVEALLNDVTAAEVKEEAPATPKKTRAPRKPRAAEPQDVVAQPGHVPTETINPTEETETPEQRRIRELEMELAKPVLKPTTDVTGRPLPESQLDADQRRIRELEDRLARQRGDAASETDPQYVSPSGKGETLLIHFLKDGLLVNGTSTYRGQEMEFEIGGIAHEQTKNRRGESFLDLVDDIDGQFDRWGDQYIARGPWRGRKWGDTSKITDPEAKAAAIAAAKAEARRGHAAPISTF